MQMFFSPSVFRLLHKNYGETEGVFYNICIYSSEYAILKNCFFSKGGILKINKKN